MEDKVKSGLLLDVVVWEGAYIFKMLVKIRHCWSVGFLLCLGSWPWHYQWCLKTRPQLMTLVKLVKICISPWRRSQPLGLPLEYKPGFWISMGVSFPTGFPNRIILIQHILFQTKFTKHGIHYDRTNVSFMISPTNPLRHPQRPLYLTASIISHHHLLLVKSGCCCKVMSLRDGRSTKNW